MSTKYLPTIIQIIGLIVIAYWVSWMLDQKATPNKEDHYHYTTDTIMVPKPYILPKPYGITTPPRELYFYLPDTVGLKQITVEVIPDSILVILDSLRTIAIHQNFLKQHPTKPKLLYSTLTKDTLTFDLLKTDGNIVSYRYPIYLNDYVYNFDGETLNRISSKSQVPKLNHGLFSDIVYNTSRGLSLSANYKAQYNRWSFITGPRVFINQDPLTWDFGIQYKIK